VAIAAFYWVAEARGWLDADRPMMGMFGAVGGGIAGVVGVLTYIIAKLAS
jgi:hypothetical protein